MYTVQSKKLLIMNILDVLRRYTDEERRLSQKEIRDILALAVERVVKSFAPDVVVLEPEGLREKVRAVLKHSLRAYQ